MNSLTIQSKVHFQCGGHRKKEMRPGEAPSAVPPGRIPRVSRLMALAIRFDQSMRDGVVADQAELARLGHVTRARMSQIMNLLCLCPTIQETILFLPPVECGKDPITERHLRPIVAVPDWRKQRRLWRVLYGNRRGPYLPSKNG